MRDFNHTMDLLVKAYMNDTLKHAECEACAVGNICRGDSQWNSCFITVEGKQIRAKEDEIIVRSAFGIIKVTSLYDPKNPKDAIEIKRQSIDLIASTGYSIDELARIEFTFEKAMRGKNSDDYMFNGLMAVLDVLAEIHEIDLSGHQVYERQLSEIFATK